jgi:hypothetical protein
VFSAPLRSGASTTKTARERRDDAVSLEKLPGARRVIGRIRGEHGAPHCHNSIGETAVTGRKEAMVTAADDADGRGAGV